MPSGKPVPDLPCLAHGKNFEVVELCPVNLMSLLPTGIYSAHGVHHNPGGVALFWPGGSRLQSQTLQAS